MDIDELIKRLQQIAKEYSGDTEVIHIKFDEALLEYVNDERISKIFKDKDLWYS